MSGRFDSQPKSELPGDHNPPSPAGDRSTMVPPLTEEVAALARLNQVLVQLASSQPMAQGDLKQALPRLAQEVAAALQVARVNIWFYDQSRQVLACREHFNLSSGEHGDGQTVHLASYPAYFAALATNRTLVADDALRNEHFREMVEDYLKPAGIGALIDSPIRAHGQMIGVLCVEHVGQARQWTAGEQGFAAAAADLVALAMEYAEHAESRRKAKEFEERLHLMVEQAPAIVWTTDRDLVLTSTEGAGLARHGAERGTAVGMKLADMVSGSEAQTILQAHRQALEGQTAAYDASWGGRVYQAVAKPLRDPQGRIQGVVGVALDVTERRQAEEALRQAHAELETRVQQRTADLTAVNRQLQEEIAERRKAENALAATEHRLMEIIDGADTAIYAKDLEGRYLLVNRRCEQILGVRREELLGQIDEQIMPPERARAVRDNDRQVIACQGPILFEEVVDDRGVPHNYLSVKFPLFDLQGKMFATCGISTDITSRIVAEQALRESEEKYRVLVQNAPAIILNVSPQGTVQYLSRKLLDVDPVQAVGRHVLDLVGSEQRGQMESSLQAVLAGQDSAELDVAASDHGEPTWFNVRMGPIRDQGKVVGATLIASDITDRRRTEQDLRMIRLAVHNVQDAVVITDAQVEAPGPHILYVNPAFSQMSGYEAHEVLGKSPRLLQGPRSDREVLNRVRQAMIQAKPFQGEIINYRKDGSEFLLRWEMAPVFDSDGRLTNWIAIQRDITQKRLEEEQLALHRAELAHVVRLSTMGEMASGLAHELNQPLAAIANFARGSLLRMKQEGYSSPRVLNAVQQIADQAERAGQIIRRMRNFIRKREPRRSTVQINELIQEAIEMTEVETRQASVRVKTSLGHDLPLILVDHIQIEQVILNLLRNAVEAMHQVPLEQRELVVSSLLLPRHILVEVRDQGRGLGEHAHSVFDPFFTTKTEGMGMGLAISRSIIDAHGGRLWASDNDGMGSTFHFTLPLSSDKP